MQKDTRPIVGVVRGEDKIPCFEELVERTRFFDVLEAKRAELGKAKEDLEIAIKPNIMVFINPRPEKYLPLVTDVELVEHLVDLLIAQGYTNLSICESRTDVSKMLENRTVAFVAEQVGYKPNGRYRLADLTLEAEPFSYEYEHAKKGIKHWKDQVGKTWREADFRVTFAKCKTHEHDYMTLGVKNVYGCLPRPNKICRYHIKEEIFDVTARLIRNFPVHFSFIDAWTGSDGYQGYKIAHEQKLSMLFGGPDVVAVDMEAFDRAGDGATPEFHKKSRFLKCLVGQTHGGEYPEYVLSSNTDERFGDICDWENVTDKVVESTDVLEEVYIAWAVVNLNPIANVADFELFPPKGFFNRLLVWVSKKLYGVFKLFKWYRRLYQRKGKT